MKYFQFTSLFSGYFVDKEQRKKGNRALFCCSCSSLSVSYFLCNRRSVFV